MVLNISSQKFCNISLIPTSKSMLVWIGPIVLVTTDAVWKGLENLLKEE